MTPARYYKILGLNPTASQTEIKTAYRKLAKRYHPDRNPSKQAHEQFIRITEAYEILMGQRQIPYDQVKSAQGSSSQNSAKTKKTPEQEIIEKAIRFKRQKEREAKIQYLQQMKRYQPLRTGWNLKFFNWIVALSLVSLFIVTLDYYLPSRLSKHRVDFWVLDGYSSFYDTNLYTLNFDDIRSAKVVGNGVLHLSENDIFFIEKSRIMKEPRAIYMPTKLDYWKLEFTKSMFTLLPYVYIFLLIPIGAWYARKNIWFFQYWFYPTLYASGPFLLYFFFDELRIIRILQLV